MEEGNRLYLIFPFNFNYSTTSLFSFRKFICGICLLRRKSRSSFYFTSLFFWRKTIIRYKSLTNIALYTIQIRLPPPPLKSRDLNSNRGFLVLMNFILCITCSYYLFMVVHGRLPTHLST